jgi:hypothetical protein
MAVHHLLLHVPSQEIHNADVRIEVWSDDEKLGELRASRGTIDWAPRAHQAPYTLTWERFDEVMREFGAH